MVGITPINRADDSPDAGDLTERARSVRAQYDREVAGINGDPSMHPAARKIRLAQSFTRATGQLRELETASDRARLFRVAASESGPWQPADALAGRDARDRAARVGSADEAAREINAASAAGDSDLVKALAHRAVKAAAERPESDWADLAADYLTKSGAADSVQRVIATQHGAESAVAKAIYWLPTPREFGRMAPYEVHALAQRDVASAVAAATAATAPQRAAWDAANRRSGNAA